MDIVWLFSMVGLNGGVTGSDCNGPLWPLREQAEGEYWRLLGGWLEVAEMQSMTDLGLACSRAHGKE